MSIFDLYDDKPLAGDKVHRQIRDDVLDYEHFKDDAQGAEIFVLPVKNLWFAYLLCAIVLIVLLGQLLKLQISQGVFNQTLAKGNRIRSREIAAPRGLIYDSQGQVLAKNKATFDLEIYPLDLPRDTEERETILTRLAEIAQMTENDISQKVTEKGYLTYDPIVLRENIDRDTALILKAKTVNLPGVIVSKRPIREYLEIEGLGGILGYVGKMSDQDLKENPNYKPFYKIGKDGLELAYEKFLHGIQGGIEIEVDARGRQQRQLSATDPAPGNNLYLSLDANLESQMAETLKNGIEEANSPGGAIIALNPQSGQILGMVSLPTYNNNLFAENTSSKEFQKLIDDQAKPMFNRAISGTYPSGSIIKPVVAAAGLQEEVITAETTINDPGEIVVGNWVYPDWKAHGLVSVRKAIAESCNVFFYAVAGGWDKIRGLGILKFKDYLGKFGFGTKSGVDLPGEAAGLVPDPDWKEQYKKEIWYLGDTYHLGIGQGDFLVTPLQMAVAMSAITNGGELLSPQIVSKITDKDGKVIQDFQKKVISANFIDNENLQIVREGMRLAVTGGSASQLQNLPVAAAAKTGTAQFGNEGKTHGWMAAFAPYNDPEIMVVAIIEAGGEGYLAAGPVVEEVLRYYFSR
ncbi:MAG: penicillin-binding protein 2 [Patescibacteria group bacterium]